MGRNPLEVDRVTVLLQGQKSRPDFSPQDRRLSCGAAWEFVQMVRCDGELGGRPQCRTERGQLCSCAAAGQTGSDRHFFLLSGWEDDPGPAAAAPYSSYGVQIPRELVPSCGGGRVAALRCCEGC